jgi:hypothetical protein
LIVADEEAVIGIGEPGTSVDCPAGGVVEPAPTGQTSIVKVADDFTTAVKSLPVAFALEMVTARLVGVNA